MFTNIPEVKCGIISVSRDCFIISLSENRRKAIVDAYSAKYGSIYEAKTTVENETDMLAEACGMSSGNIFHYFSILPSICYGCPILLLFK